MKQIPKEDAKHSQKSQKSNRPNSKGNGVKKDQKSKNKDESSKKQPDAQKKVASGANSPVWTENKKGMSRASELRSNRKNRTSENEKISGLAKFKYQEDTKKTSLSRERNQKSEQKKKETSGIKNQKSTSNANDKIKGFKEKQAEEQKSLKENAKYKQPENRIIDKLRVLETPGKSKKDKFPDIPLKWREKMDNHDYFKKRHGTFFKVDTRLNAFKALIPIKRPEQDPEITSHFKHLFITSGKHQSIKYAKVEDEFQKSQEIQSQSSRDNKKKKREKKVKKTKKQLEDYLYGNDEEEDEKS